MERRGASSTVRRLVCARIDPSDLSENAILEFPEGCKGPGTGLTSSSLDGQLTELGCTCLLLLPTALFAQKTVLDLARLAQGTKMLVEVENRRRFSCKCEGRSVHWYRTTVPS